MQHIRPYLLFIAAVTFLVPAMPNNLCADVNATGRTLSIRFPAFPLNPGQKVAGIRVKTSRGWIQNSCLPSRWTCDRKDNSIYCHSMHPSYATAMTGRLPELFVVNLPDGGSQLSIEASVEYLETDGSESTREFRESDLIIQ